METIGTFFLLLVIMGTLVDGRAPAGWGGFIVGLMVAGEIFAFGPITNVALNPARAFGPALLQVLLGGKYDLSHLIVYIAGPLLGGTLGVLTYDFLQRARTTGSVAIGGISESAVEQRRSLSDV
ncbi:MAG: aquaporin, partial [Ktedonobacteraceae bacterium]|nr:aquaporin [Ktedonobacteraceae bacterium]